MKLWVLLAGLCLPVFCWSQNILSGPIVGGVTANAASVYLQTNLPATIEVEIASDTSFQTSSRFQQTTNEPFGNAVIIPVQKLEPLTTYFYRIRINDSLQTGCYQFQTFPAKETNGNFTFTVGACQMRGKDPFSEPIFNVMLKHKPQLFLEVGDWGYPDTTDLLPDKNTFFPSNLSYLLKYYQKRYSIKEMKALFHSTPVDYVYDDHDFMNDNSSRNSCSYYHFDGPGDVKEIPNPPGARRNAINGYYHCFPHYQLPDTSEGIYHSFRAGNCEFFVLDNRSARSSNLDALVKKGKKYYYRNVPQHTMLGEKQKQWFLNAIKSSDAHWKFVVSGVNFNHSFRSMITMLEEKKKPLYNFIIKKVYTKRILTSLVDTWAGFQQEHDEILQFCRENNIQNVVMLSGDSHLACLEDGAMGALPEMSCGSLSGFFNLQPKFYNYERFNNWNVYMQGMYNKDYHLAFGKSEVFGADSVRLSVWSSEGKVMGSMTIASGFLPAPTAILQNKLKPHRDLHFQVAEANLAYLHLNVKGKTGLFSKLKWEIWNEAGKQVATVPVQLKKNKQQIEIQNLPKGNYFVRIQGKDGYFSRRFQKV